MLETECEYCMEVRDDNEYLIFDDICDNYVQIRCKHNEDKFRLQCGNSFRMINFCPMCGRKLVKRKDVKI